MTPVLLEVYIEQAAKLTFSVKKERKKHEQGRIKIP